MTWPNAPLWIISLIFLLYGVYLSTWPTASSTPHLETSSTIWRHSSIVTAIGFSNRIWYPIYAQVRSFTPVLYYFECVAYLYEQMQLQVRHASYPGLRSSVLTLSNSTSADLVVCTYHYGISKAFFLCSFFPIREHIRWRNGVLSSHSISEICPWLSHSNASRKIWMLSSELSKALATNLQHAKKKSDDTHTRAYIEPLSPAPTTQNVIGDVIMMMMEQRVAKRCQQQGSCQWFSVHSVVFDRSCVNC